MHFERVCPSTMRHKVYELQLPARNGSAICCERNSLDHVIFYGHAERVNVENAAQRLLILRMSATARNGI